MDLHDPQILAMAAAQYCLLEDEYDEYAATNNNVAAFCRSIFVTISISLDDNLFQKGVLLFFYFVNCDHRKVKYHLCSWSLGLALLG